MRTNYKRLGDYIEQVNVRNSELRDIPLVGLSLNKVFIPSIANTIGTNMATYKIIKRNQFAYGPVTSRNGEKITIALFKDYDEALISQAYLPFKIVKTDKLLPDYLMMWFSRPEFDRYTRYKSHGSARETFDWTEMCDVLLPVPPIEEQEKIVAEYQAIENKIKVNQQICEKLEATAQAIYKEWFVEFNFPFDFAQGKPDKNGKPYKDNGGKMVWNAELEKEVPEGWGVSSLGDYTTVKSGFAFKSEWWQSNGIPVIKIGNINNNTIDITTLDYVGGAKIEKAKSYIVQKGDIVIAMTGATLGKIGLVPKFDSIILVNQRVGMFDLGENPIKKAPFLYTILLSEYVQNEIKSVGGDSAQANISGGQIEEIKIILSSDHVIDNFNEIGIPIIENILNKIQENQKLTELKSLLLARMVK